MEKRLKLHQKLSGIASSVSDNCKVYFQPPEKLKLEYPCIIYKLERVNTTHASNSNYKRNYQFQVMFISRKARLDVVELIEDLEWCTLSNVNTSDGLYQYTFAIYI